VAKARVEGFQGTDYNDRNTVLACAKHFAAYGAAVAGKDKKMQECYGTDKISDEAKTEISSTVKYFQAHGAKDVNIDSCDAISESKNYTYVYIRYNLVLQNIRASVLTL
jgi:hypothetical protein